MSTEVKLRKVVDRSEIKKSSDKWETIIQELTDIGVEEISIMDEKLWITGNLSLYYKKIIKY